MLNHDSILYEQPGDINVQLKQHQRAMLHRCLEIEKKSKLGIMRDKPGAGKTYVILAMINELKKQSLLIEKENGMTNEQIQECSQSNEISTILSSQEEYSNQGSNNSDGKSIQSDKISIHSEEKSIQSIHSDEESISYDEESICTNDENIPTVNFNKDETWDNLSPEEQELRKNYLSLDKKIQQAKLNQTDVNIIIVPQNLYYQWMLSIETISDELTYSKFIDYSSIQDLYSYPEHLYGKDIIITTSSYYSIISSILKSLDLRIKRVFIDEIDSISNLITKNINAEFIMLVSASFNIRQSGFFTKEINSLALDEITCVCEPSFVDEFIILEEPISEQFLCSNILVDEILSQVVSEEEMKNINAMEFKLNNKHYEKTVAYDEKELIKIILHENKALIKSSSLKIVDLEKNIENLEALKNNQQTYLLEFQKHYQNLDIIYNFKKNIMNLINQFQPTFNFYLHFKLESDLSDVYELVLEKRRLVCKNLRIHLNNIVEVLYNFRANTNANKKATSMNDNENQGETKSEETPNYNMNFLESSFKQLVALTNLSQETIKTIQKEFKQHVQVNMMQNAQESNEPKKSEEEINPLLTTFLENYFTFEVYVDDFQKTIVNLKKSFEANENLQIEMKQLEENKEIIEENNRKIAIIEERFRENNLCPVCYTVMEDYFISSKCCINKICSTCVNHWFHELKNRHCIYCATTDIDITSYVKYTAPKPEEGDSSTLNSSSVKVTSNDVEAFLEEQETCIQKEEDEFISNDIPDLLRNSPPTQQLQYGNTKLSFIQKFIDDNKDKYTKTIIFSDFPNILHRIENYCTMTNVDYTDLDKGNIREIEQAVIDYKVGNSKILLANSSLFGCGMNLENSTHIIFVHKMNKKMKNQVIGRAQRMGRKGALHIIFLEYENEKYVYNEVSNDNCDQYNNAWTEENINESRLFHIDEEKSSTIYDLKSDSDSDSESEKETESEIENQQNQETENLPEIPIPEAYTEHVDVNLEELIASLH